MSTSTENTHHVNEYELDVLAAAHFVTQHNAASLADESRSTIVTAHNAAVNAVVNGRPPQVGLETLTHALSCSNLLAETNRRVEECRRWRSTMNELKKDKDAWMLMSCTSGTPHQILPRLWLGGYYTSIDEAALQQMGVTHILSCIDTEVRFPDRYTYHTVALEDSAMFDPTPYFRDTTRFITEALTGDGVVFVHCGSGISRAPTVVSAFLIATFGLSSIQALQLVRRIRPCVYPNKGFVEHLAQYAENIHAPVCSQG